MNTASPSFSKIEAPQDLTVRRDDVQPGLPEPVDPILNRAARRKKARRFSAKDLMQEVFEPQRFVVKDLIPAGLLMLAGAPKIGKSWAVLDLALSVASGRSFLGRETDAGDVLYLALEDTPRRLQERLKLVAPGTDWDTLPLEFWTEAEAIDDGGLEAVTEWLRAAQNPKLIVIDVWGRFALKSPSAKNEYDHLTQTFQPLQALAAEYGVAIVLVHHTRKAQGDAAPSGDPFDQIIGSRAMTSNMDAALMLTRTRMQQDATLSITGRDIEEAAFNLTFDKSTYRWNETDKPSAPVMSHERQQVFDAFVAGHQTADTIGKQLGKSRTAVQNHLTALLADSLLQKTGRGKWHLPSADTAPESEPATPTDMTDIADNPLAEAEPDPFYDLV
ncbi:AAA family ATPase [Deinococcus sp.]|uniref:AAA family ATPase n=1 Tax=Deinococcus sp. TaxID=47478 RepID=UPI003B5BF0EB